MSNAEPAGEPLIGAIEAGGSKVVCALGRNWREIRDAEKFVVPTTTPGETTDSVMDWFEAHHHSTPLAAIGIASFGPVNFSSMSIATTTPKLAWRGHNWREVVARRLSSVAVGVDTDTNAAGIAESRWGAAQRRRIAAYVTVGTGIGGALIVDGEPLHGLLHPETGHMFVPRQRGDQFGGTCPAHGDCLEGLASGVALSGRWDHAAAELSSDHPAWELESDYLALGLVNIIMVASPQIIVLGGGVMAAEGLLERVRQKVRRVAAGYIDRDELAHRVDSFIVRPGLGPAAGVVGAFALGCAAAARDTNS